jgi:hypothetical protein
VESAKNLGCEDGVEPDEDGELMMEDGVFVPSSILHLPFSLERT